MLLSFFLLKKIEAIIEPGTFHFPTQSTTNEPGIVGAYNLVLQGQWVLKDWSLQWATEFMNPEINPNLETFHCITFEV